MKKTTLLILLLCSLFSINGFTKNVINEKSTKEKVSALSKDKDFINYYKLSLKFASKADLTLIKNTLYTRNSMAKLSIEEKDQISKAYGFNSYKQLLKINEKLAKIEKELNKKYPELTTSDRRELVYAALREDVKNKTFTLSKSANTNPFFCEEALTGWWGACVAANLNDQDFLDCVTWSTNMYLLCLLWGGDGNPV